MASESRTIRRSGCRTTWRTPSREKRPNYAAAQAKMKQVCSQCHTPALIDRVYSQAEQVVQGTNDRVRAAQDHRERLAQRRRC